MSISKITGEQFQADVLESDTPVLVDFFATWCGPCKILEPVLSDLAAGYEGKVKFVKVDIEEADAVASQYAVVNVPTLLLFKGGKEAGRKVGAAPKPTLVSWINDTTQVA